MSYRLLLTAFIIALNAFFAAAEVALISVRQSRLRTLAEKGHVGAQAALSLLAHPERLLSVTQLGVTLASLGLGWAGEDALYEILLSFFTPIDTPGTKVLLHGFCFGVAFVIISFAHVVIGEVVPKNLGMEKADRLAVLVAPLLLVFYKISVPFVYVIERSVVAVSRLLGLHGKGHSGGHSVEELKFIISSSRREGHLPRFEEDAIRRIIELQNFYAREIMVPRNQIVSVSINSSLEQLLHLMTINEYSRIAVYEGRPEHIIGVVHYKDLMRFWEDRRLAKEKRGPNRPFHMRRLLRKPLVVPETKPLNQLIDEFRQSHTHMAIVVDEFGTIVGLVTLEDVLEQIFGEIGDEHDVKRPAPPKEDDIIELEGATSIRDLETQYEIYLPGDAGFETLAGFLMFQLGYIPTEGQVVEYGARTFKIIEMNRNRIVRVRVEKIKKPVEAGRESAGAAPVGLPS